MTSVLSSDALDTLAAMVLERWGLLFPEDRHKDLRRGVEAAATGLGLPTRTFLEMLLREPAHPSRGKLLSILVEKLTVGESYFFRETRSIHALDESLLPALIHAGAQEGTRRLRLWSAGCATGEEPYTLSILLDRVLRRMGERREAWDVEILATDINREFLRRARTGVYRPWSFRAAPPWLREQYFEQVGDNRWRVKDEVRDSVRFKIFNLCAGDAHLERGHGMDIILCRNVLIYFSYEKMTCALKTLRRHLAKNGRLITSPTETAHVLETGVFKPCRELDMLAFCRSDAEPVSKFQAPLPYAYPKPDTPIEASGADMAATQSPAGTAHVPAPPTQEPRISDHAVVAPSTAPPTVDEAGGVLEAAEAALAQGDLQRAEALAKKYLDGNGSSPSGTQAARAKALVARALSSRGKLEDALAWAAGAVESESMNPEHRFHQGVILQELGRIDEAAASLEQALYLDPSLPMARFSLGLLARRKGNESAAQRHFMRLLAVLDQLDGDEPVPLSEGLSAARLRELVESLLLSR
ncbi:hypothetical protein DPQ33_03100 [Oceanidesulfovibrio indonesiensis]|uniref:CheR-type methyltransferase domain-containing protein n=1 Tax=Oceanidesulfovibrio indonesiensis TaxID=54767 RepID=A0A7M3MI45_9BACT|nr:protein-glutamate O-methyltransferase CheR [Oceanidesulfovibrio indonesiensis]TVM19362.1 hypothetical protein DPQ33_03100 [Oceanidesulfovibrio indonesiensis]